MIDRLKLWYYLLRLEVINDYLMEHKDKSDPSNTDENTEVLGLFLNYAYKALGLSCLDREERTTLQRMTLKTQQVRSLLLLLTIPKEHKFLLCPLITPLMSHIQPLIIGTNPVSAMIHRYEQERNALYHEDKDSLASRYHERFEPAALSIIIKNFVLNRTTLDKTVELINADISILRHYRSIIIPGPPIPESLRSITQQLFQ